MWDEKRRVPIKASVKHAVYKRARGKCEVCGTPLAMNEGDFHHTRDPTVSPMAKTVQFLCPLCHRRYGHRRTVRTESTLFSSEKVVRVKRLKAPTLKNSRSDTKKKQGGKAKRKNPERARTKSGRFRKKRSDAGKRRS